MDSQCGQYLVAMNRSQDKAYEIDLPEGFDGATDLITGQTFNGSVPELLPGTSYALYLSDTGQLDSDTERDRFTETR